MLENTLQPAANETVENAQPATMVENLTEIPVPILVTNTPIVATEPKLGRTKSISFSKAEMAAIDGIVQERIKAGITTDWSNFLRQCIDFTLNHGMFIGKQYFGLPDGYEQKLLQNGFFANHPTAANKPILQ